MWLILVAVDVVSGKVLLEEKYPVQAGPTVHLNGQFKPKDQAPCPPDWTHVPSLQQCYIVSNTTMAATDAQTDCKNNAGGNLVSVLSQAEYDQLKTIVQGTNPIDLVWIGLWRPGPFGLFQWVDGNNATYRKWADGQPQVNSGDCVAWQTTAPDGWITLDCSYQQRFICKQEAARCPASFYNASTSGVITSTNYPDNYENNLDCLYQIVAPAGSIIDLAFTYFNTEYQYDNVTVFDGLTTNPDFQIATISGGWTDSFDGLFRMPLRFYSRGNAFTVRFQSDHIINYRGFSASYTSLVPQATLYRDPTGEVQSPNYPADYPNNTHVMYSIGTVPGARLFLGFDSVVIESSWDYLDIFDGPSMTANRTARLSGQLATGTTYNVTSTGASMFLRFFSDPSYVYRGFHLTYSTIL